MKLECVNVHIAEAKTGRNNVELQTILGSCIGIGLLWKKREFYGLAHCLLPSAPENFDDGTARYVDQAIDRLIEMMSITSVKDIRAVVAGGANMTLPGCANPERLVGTQNARSAIATLDNRGIRIVHEDTGGELGRKMSIDCTTGLFDVRAIPRQSK